MLNEKFILIIYFQVSGKSYCVGDTNILCNSDFYKQEIISTNIMIAFFFGILIPGSLALWTKNGKTKNKLNQI